MANLNSPGVAVTVIDESQYALAAPGTVPLIIVTSAENKLNTSGTSVTPGTLKANADTVYLLTSQKDLVDTFGDPIFITDVENNPIHASEQNEYGLQAAYDFLGVSNRAFVARADIDLSQITASDHVPTYYPADGTYWFDCLSSFYGIFEWNGSPATAVGGQTFTNKLPIVIIDHDQVVNFDASDFRPKESIGVIGDYAIVTVSSSNIMYFKNKSGNWVVLGSNEWSKSWPTIAGTKSLLTLNPGDNFFINGNLVTAGSSLTSLADNINAANIYAPLGGPAAITAAVVNNKLEIYNDGSYTSGPADSASGDGIHISAGTVGNLVSVNAANSVLGIGTGFYYNPKLTMSKHTQIPEYKTKQNYPRPSGSVWVKTTQPNFGANWRLKRFRASTQSWYQIETPLYENAQTALYELDRANGGLNIPQGNVFINFNFEENYGLDSSPTMADFKLMRRNGVGETTITSKKVLNNTLNPGVKSFLIAESVLGSNMLGDYNRNGTYSAKTVVVTVNGTSGDADSVAAAINATGFTNVYASVDKFNQISIKHKLGGDFRIKDGVDTILLDLGFTEFNLTTGQGTTNLYTAPDGDVLHDFVASLWIPLNYIPSAIAPTSLAEDGTLWYSSIMDEVDIMIHDGTHWVGYQSQTSPYYSYFVNDRTDPLGPIVSASVPELQSDGTSLVTGDLWIDSSDTENYPRLYKFNAEFENASIKDRWILVDTTDQTTENGVVFGDARFNVSGELSDSAGSIVSLLTSDFVDFDAPDPALYPKGMLLWNMRRSGFNVKKFVYKYINTSIENVRFGAAPFYAGESMSTYYPHRWVTVSGRQENGAGNFGRKAQRRVVVEALQKLVNSNQHIRDEEGRDFNLMACPGYPELIGELIKLNYDRGLTAFVVGDTPARLASDATTLLAWGNNEKLALEDNDLGAVSSDEYMGMFYPWGYTSDNSGRNVVVPPSHMMLRTIALSDESSYQWFAPAGTTRGIITNATAVGYVDPAGEFKAVALNTGQRDTLYDVRINPITFFAGSGLVNYGQKTRARLPSSLDRINVSRLVVYLRRRLSLLAKPFIFQPNDRITRNELKAVIESLMLELVGNRAITDYLVVVDESNNTPLRIDRNELYADVAIVPVKAVEFIYIPLRLKNTGAIGGA
jgi:hypothetical protein